MGLKQQYTKRVHETMGQGYMYTFESDFVLAMMRMKLKTSISVVLQIEEYVDDNYLFSPDDSFELAGVVKGKDPYYFVIEVVHLDHMQFCNIFEISSDEYLDYYNKNLILRKE